MSIETSTKDPSSENSSSENSSLENSSSVAGFPDTRSSEGAERATEHLIRVLGEQIQGLTSKEEARVLAEDVEAAEHRGFGAAPPNSKKKLSREERREEIAQQILSVKGYSTARALAEKAVWVRSWQEEEEFDLPYASESILQAAEDAAASAYEKASERVEVKRGIVAPEDVMMPTELRLWIVCGRPRAK